MPYFKINRGIRQLVYRLQNHALDLHTLENHSDALMVLVKSDQIPTSSKSRDKSLTMNS